MELKTLLDREFVLLDGGMGTMLQRRGLPMGAIPELMNLEHPEWLLEKNGFNLLGSRSADGRVPSIWMSQNAPRLGAVWPNSRHTWLGNAYCTARRGVSLFK